MFADSFLERKCVATVQDAVRTLYRCEVEIRMKTEFWICVYRKHEHVDSTVAGKTQLLSFYSKNCSNGYEQVVEDHIIVLA